ncbi:MAG: class I SAM-dependent methyltransferase [Polyangiales bacterium]
MPDTQHPQRDYLTDYLAHAPAALALLRAVECRELAALRFDRPILDVGCGDGLFGRVFFESPVEVGFDRSERELATAARHGAYRELVRGDVAQLPFSDGRFATVFSNGVLEHVDQLDAGLREIARVLRPGGRLIMTVPTMRDELELSGAAVLRALGLPDLATRYADSYNRFFHHVNLHEPDEWRVLLKNAGLSLVQHRRYAVPSVFRLHDLMLPQSLPNFVCKAVTGKWSVLPAVRSRTAAPFWSRVLRRIYEDSSDGCSLLLVAERSPA